MEKKYVAVLVAVLLSAAVPAFSQMADQPAQPETITLAQSEGSQSQISVMGKIVELDLSQGTVTLDNGEQFTLAPSFQYTSFPAIGQQVEVTYQEEGGKRVAHSIEVNSTGDSSQ